jgi:hypothetical protein
MCALVIAVMVQAICQYSLLSYQNMKHTHQSLVEYLFLLRTLYGRFVEIGDPRDPRQQSCQVQTNLDWVEYQKEVRY